MDVNTSANTCLITYSFTCLSQGSSRKHKGSGLTLKLYFSSICRHRETFNWWKSILLKSIGTLVTQTESTTGSTQIMCFVDEPKTKWTETNFLFYLVHTGNHIQTKKKKSATTNRKIFVHKARPQEVKRAGQRRRLITAWQTLRWCWSVCVVYDSRLTAVKVKILHYYLSPASQ